MAIDESGLSDDVRADLNPDPDDSEPGDQPARIPDRPADGAKKGKWAEYVIALGLHPDEADKYSRDDLIELADRLGG